MGMFDVVGVSPDDFSDENMDAMTGAEGEETELQEGEEEQANQEGGQEGGQQEQQEGQQAQQQGQEELLKAYQQQMQQMQSELAQLRQQTQQQEQQGQEQQEQEWTEEDWQNFDNQFMEQFAQNPGQTVYGLVTNLMEQYLAPINEYFQAQAEEQHRDDVVENELINMINATDVTGNPLYPDIEELADQLDEYIEQHPEILDAVYLQGIKRAEGSIKDGDFGILDTLYRAVKASATETLGEQAFQKGLQQGAQQVQMKKKAAIQKTGANNPNPTPTPEEQVINDIMSFRRGGMFG